jgi:hypothetical protein
MARRHTNPYTSQPGYVGDRPARARSRFYRDHRGERYALSLDALDERFAAMRARDPGFFHQAEEARAASEEFYLETGQWPVPLPPETRGFVSGFDKWWYEREARRAEEDD